MMDLNGRVAVITGGGTGIGRATALMLADRGANVVINYSRSAEDAEATVRELQQRGVRAVAHQADVAHDGAVRTMVDRTLQEFGRLDIVVNNAGRTHFVPLDDLEGMKEDLWDAIMDVNVKGAFFLSRAAASELKKHSGCIVNVASIAAFTGRGSCIAYAASKAALLSVTRSLAIALGPQVRVNAVAPGIVLSRWVAGQEEHVQRYSSGAPLGRAAEPEDVAEVVLSLIDRATLVTGQTWTVDGGISM